LTVGAQEAGISITGGEVSQLPDSIRGFDLVGAATGIVYLDSIITGKDIAHKDVVIGIHSNGLHSNGFTLARNTLFEKNFLDPNARLPELGGPTLLQSLMVPTPIYVKEIMTILDTHRRSDIKALINITGDGLLNLNRVDTTVGFIIDNLPRPPDIFKTLQRRGGLDIVTLFEVFNMGVGFCIVCSPEVVASIQDILGFFGRSSSIIGRITTHPDVTCGENTVVIPQHGLVGTGKRFRISGSDQGSIDFI
jgi:phosphoribosylformylglycinamidine cyclo-ligase